jgi:superfamily II DNA/RNA helicase
MTFDTLGLSARVTAAVAAAGYTTPTPIQAQAIPHVLARRDLLGIAQTGTGKTAAFTLPMISLLEQGRARARMPRTLILEPTRELAMQVEEKFKEYGAGQKLSVALLIGGVSFNDQDEKITRGVDVLIATPGRLLDHFERGKLLLSGIEVLVIDEADRMLDMGFIPDIERIAKLCPFTRQTLFFTATMPPEIQRIADTFLSSPVRIEVAKPATTAATITQGLVASGGKDFEKRGTLRRLIREAEGDGLKNAIIFCNRKSEVALLHRSLLRHNFSVASLHGDMDQRARMAALDAFRKNQITLLVASDVAARGLDIPDVSHVFNYDVPIHADDYVHRIGRTGRAGRSGVALSIVARSDVKYVEAIEKLIGRTIDWRGPDLATFVPPPSEDDEGESRGRSRSARGGRDGARGRSSREGAKAAGKSGEGRAPASRRAETPGPAARQPAAEARPAADQSRAQESRSQEARAPRRAAPARTEQRPARRERGEDGASVVGFGDQLPGFMQRPAAKKAG